MIGSTFHRVPKRMPASNGAIVLAYAESGVFGEVVLSCWIDTDSDAERLNVRLGKPL